MHKQISLHIISVPTECKSRRRKALPIIHLVSQEIFFSLIVFYINTPEETERPFANASQWKSESKPEEDIKKKKGWKKDFTKFKWLQVGFTSIKFSHFNVRHLVSSVQLWFLNSHQSEVSPLRASTSPTLGWAESPSSPTFLILPIAEGARATSLATSSQTAEHLVTQVSATLHSKAFRWP